MFCAFNVGIFFDDAVEDI